MARRKKSKTHPLEGLVNFELGKLKAGDEIVYKRLGDGKNSIGIIQYFEKGTKNKDCVTVIDLILSHFQTVHLEDIVKDPTAKLVHALRNKAANPGRRK
jgi:hypothetical protein